MVAIESIFRTSKPANLEATWHRREFPSPDGRWTLRLNYAGEPRMGMDVYRLALHDAGRDVSVEHPAITQGPTQAWWQYVPTTQPWSSDSRCLVVATWGARGVGETTYLYDVLDRCLRPCPFNAAARAEASLTQPEFLLAARERAIVVSTSMETRVDLSVAKPGDHPYWRWLRCGNTVLHFPGWGSLDGPLTIFDARDGSTLTQIPLDCEEIVPFDPQPTRVFVDAGKAFTWDDAVARKQCPARWHSVHFDAALYTLYLSTSRPAGDPFLVKPPVPEDTPKLFNPVLASLDAIIWTLSKISGESPPDPEQMPASVRCKTREEWVGVRLREN